MSEIAKIQGYDIRDKKLADATSQNTVAQTDAIEMKTTGGEQVYIARDSFVDAIAAVFKSNSKSTITTLFGEETSDNTSSIGSINMSNLKSALGVGNIHCYTVNLTSSDEYTLGINVDNGAMVIVNGYSYSFVGILGLVLNPKLVTISITEGATAGIGANELPTTYFFNFGRFDGGVWKFRQGITGSSRAFNFTIIT